MSDVLLVYPPHRIILGGRTYSPLGLAYMASVLEKNGFSVRILDFDVVGFDSKKLFEVIECEKPRVIGVNVLTSALPEAYLIVALIKSRFDIPIVLGGSHVTEVPEVVSDMGVEYGIRGEGDYAFLRLCEHLITGNAGLDEVGGLVLNDGGSTTYSEPVFVDGLDGLPNPAWHLLDMRKYLFKTLMASRGCPFNCIFCADPHCTVRHRCGENVLDEMRLLRDEYGVRRVDFSDSVFTLDKDWVYGLCDMMDRERLNLKWTCLTRVDCVDDDILSRMKDSGCFLIYFGVESGVEEIRFNSGKRITNDEIRHAFRYCRKIGVKTGSSAMFGFPGENIHQMRDTLRFIIELDPEYGVFSLPELMPGTRLFKTALSEGYATDDLWRDYMSGMVKDLYYVPKGLSFSELYEVDLEAHRRFYYRPSYILRRMAGIRSRIEFSETADAFIRYVSNNITNKIPDNGIS
ncbi:MAG: radical SAM protein [Candidatus Altiarchaeota archaeon]